MSAGPVRGLAHPRPCSRPPDRRLTPLTTRRAAQSNENIAPAVIMSVAKELRKLSCEPLDGIKVVLNEEDVSDVTAEITGPGARALRQRPRANSSPPPAET